MVISWLELDRVNLQGFQSRICSSWMKVKLWETSPPSLLLEITPISSVVLLNPTSTGSIRQTLPHNWEIHATTKELTMWHSLMDTQMSLQLHLPMKSGYGTVKTDSNFLESKFQDLIAIALHSCRMGSPLFQDGLMAKLEHSFLNQENFYM